MKEVPGVFSQGETLEELEHNITDAYRMMMAEEESAYSPSTAVKVKEVVVTM